MIMMAGEVFYLFLVLFVYDVLKSLVQGWLNPKEQPGKKEKHMVFRKDGTVLLDDYDELRDKKGVIEHGNPKGKG